MNRRRTEEFQGREDTLYNIVMMDTCHYICDFTHRTYNTKREPEGNGLWVIMMYQGRFINCSQWSTLAGDADHRRGYA